MYRSVRSGVSLLKNNNVGSLRKSCPLTFTNGGQVRWAATRSSKAMPKQSLKERMLAPTTGAAFDTGKLVLAGSSALGIGALCYYGLGLSSTPGTIEEAALFPQYVKERIRNTYTAFGSGLAITAVAAAQAFKSPMIMRIMSSGSLVTLGVSMVAIIASGMVVRSMEYSGAVCPKSVAWAGHSALMGVFLAPMAALGGPLLIRAAWYTAGVLGGLSAIAVCAPSDKFLYSGGILGMGLGAVIVANIGSLFFAPTTALGAGLYSVVLYGGVVLFSGFALYDTQRIIHQAKHQSALTTYDPINGAIGIYMTTINMFIRIAMLLSGGGSRRK